MQCPSTYSTYIDTRTAYSFNTTMDESLEKWNPKNPLLLSPIIRCVFKFLNFKEIKNCRFVCHEWGLTGKAALGSRSIIRFQCRPGRRPADFYSRFESTATVFSAFKMFGYANERSTYWREEELTNFFEEQKRSIKELEMDLISFPCSSSVDLSSWISQSPLVQKNAKHMTKLSIKIYRYESGQHLHIPLHLIAYIKDLTLWNCRINIEAGIKISPIKLNLTKSTFFQDGNKLNQVRINDIVDFSKAREVLLICARVNPETKCIVDLSGNTHLEKLNLENCEILNGETSQWIIENLRTTLIPYSLNKEMKIKELYLSQWYNLDLFTLPNSIQKLSLHGVNDSTGLDTSHPFVLENLQYLNVTDMNSPTDHRYLAKFMHCPQLTHLKLKGFPKHNVMNSHWLPKNVKTLTLEHDIVSWLDNNDLNLTKLVFIKIEYSAAKRLCKTNIHVDDVVIYYLGHTVNTSVVELLEHQKICRFCKRLFIGELKWGQQQLENSLLKEHVNVKSPFYVFENGEKGRALSKKAFFELTDIPKHFET